jgi:hypothetical protein
MHGAGLSPHTGWFVLNACQVPFKFWLFLFQGVLKLFSHMYEGVAYGVWTKPDH